MSKVKEIIFIFLLIFFPSQLGFHFWPQWSFINGIRIDYFSPTLYMTDILLGLLFLFQIPSLKLKIPRNQIYFFPVIAICILLNVYFSLSPVVSIYKWLKILESGFLIWFVKTQKINLKWLTIPVFYEALLVFWQILNQGSAGGLWYLLGERFFNAGTPGIANTSINGQLFLRPYGTFPHPNVLGGWMAVVSSLVLNPKTKFLAFISVLMSLSRSAILSLVISNKKILVVALLVLLPFLLHSQSLTVRWQLTNVALQQFLKSPLVGTGLGTSPLYQWDSSLNYALSFQPIHNIYLLVLSETGLLGFGLFLFLIFKSLKKSKLILPILFIGLFDHYFLTLQQGQLLFALVLGLTFRKMVPK